VTTVVFTASGTWTAPSGLTPSTANTQCWAEGGNGGTGITGGSSHSGGGGGGGEYAGEASLAVTSGSNYSYTIGGGGSSTNTIFPGDSVTVTAHHGASGVAASHGAGGTGSSNTTHHDGGTGGNGITTSNPAGGGGGGGAGSTGAGGTGGAGLGGGTGGAGGTAGTPDGGTGGHGGAGNVTGNPGQDGILPGGGGGGGSGRTGGTSGGNGAGGQITLTYSAATTGTAALSGVGTLTAAGAIAGAAALAGVGTLTAAQSGHGVAALAGVGTLTASATQQPGAALSGVGTLTAQGGLPTPAVVNQWANSYGQGDTFGATTPAAQSCVVPLDSAFSVGTGSGTPTAGNWLFAIASWTQNPSVANVHVGASDDVHSWWRQFPASGAAGNVRTSVSYTPNLARAPQYVYVAPDGAVAAVNVLVVEISGLGPWDTLVGTETNYTASGTSLALSLNHTGTDFYIAGVGGNNIASGQAFAPGGWTALATQTQSNGVDTTADNILTSAFLPSTSSNQSVSASASSSESMSGFILAVKVSGDDPIPASQNANWPYTIFEAAFGAGFNTPNSELTWTDLTTRLWSWDEITGIQYQLGQLQATNLNLEVDNYDGALTPVSSPWSFATTGTPSTHSYFTVSTADAASISVGDGFTDTVNAGTSTTAGQFFVVTSIGAPSGGLVNVSFTPAATSVMTSDTVSQASLVAGTPIRIRQALGTLGGQAINRWYVLQRNCHEWEEEVNANYRRWCPVSGTDLWSAMSSVPPTFYRAEVYQDNPVDWWPMDDQPGEGGVQPVTLLNAASGSTTVMDIVPSPGGVTTQNAYGANGVNLTNLTASLYLTVPPPSVATYSAGANSGWMYGDPPSSSSSFSSATGNPVEPSAGSASWQQAGLLGSTGSNGWFLSANAAFPGLSAGVTVKGWFNCEFYGSSSAFEYNSGGPQTDTTVLGQPHSVITVCTLATGSAPVAILQLDISGHLNLITYNGTTGTSHSIYSTSDLRCGGWIAVDMLFTTTTWRVLVNGGLTADVSGSATGMTSAWTYLILDGDMGTSGGASPSAIQHGGNMALAHWAVFGYQLPAWRLLAHYTAAVTGFGLLPAPVTQVQSVVSVFDQAGDSQSATFSATPDGWYSGGSYGGNSPPAVIGAGGSITTYSCSVLMTANAGSYSSAPSARAVLGGQGGVGSIGASQYSFGAVIWASLANPNAPVYTVYTSSDANNETGASTILGLGDVFTSGYGASAAGAGVAQIAGGTGASPPSSATPLGDTVGQRIERLMNAGRTTSPQRSIDPASGLVQAPGVSGGGQQMNTSIQAIQQSDGGMLAVDSVGNLFYWSRDHLASQYSSPVWTLTPDAPPAPGASATALPYYLEYRIVSDPQRIFNVVTVQPFSPSGAQLPLLTPTDAAGVTASQARYGAQQYPVTSWLQDQAVMQAQADFLFTNFGQPQVRAENVRVDAAPYPAAFELVMGVNVGDVVTLTSWEVGSTGQTLTLRVTEINRKLRFGGQNEGNAGEGTVVASVELTCDFEPSSYF